VGCGRTGKPYAFFFRSPHPHPPPPLSSLLSSPPLPLDPPCCRPSPPFFFPPIVVPVVQATFPATALDFLCPCVSPGRFTPMLRTSHDRYFTTFHPYVAEQQVTAGRVFAVFLNVGWIGIYVTSRCPCWPSGPGAIPLSCRSIGIFIAVAALGL